jgi:hypothetical protein
MRLPRGWNHKLTTSALTAFALGVIVAFLQFVWWDSYAVLSMITGVAIGWAAGIVLSPYENETKKFNGWSKTLAGFFGGYGLTKLEYLLGNLSEKQRNALLDIVVLRRIWIGIFSFLITAIVVFVFRNYYEVDPN